MDVKETLKDGLKRGYVITLTAQELDDKVTQKLMDARPEIEIKGFRKGKVPMPVLKKQFGARLLGEAMQETIDGTIAQHFEDKGERPAAQPDVKMTNENWKEGDDIEVSLSYEALPDIPEVDFNAIKLEKFVVNPSETEVTEALERLAETAKNFELKEDAAETGDQVVFDFVGRIDGAEFDGGAAEDFPLVLGSNQFIPGFEDQLVGVMAGDDKDITVTFPDDYNAENLAGKEAVFSCKIKEVKGSIQAPIDDALAEKFGAENLEKLKAQITERLSTEYATAARQVLKRGALDQLDEMVNFDLPTSLVEAEAKQIAHQLWHEENPDVKGHDHPEITPTQEHINLATRRVRLGLLIADVGQKKAITVSDAEMTQAIMSQARQYPGQEKQFFDFVKNNDSAKQQINAPLFEDKVIDYILELADVAEKDVTKDELEQAIEALDDD